MSVYLTLAGEFLKIGLFSVGGGLATLPFLYKLADSHDWFTRATLVDMIAISESTPGPIGINMATYAGYAAAGVYGGVLATLALVFPSVVIALFITKALDAFRDDKSVKAAFYGVRPAVTALIASAALGFMKMMLIDIENGSSAANILNVKRIALFAVTLYLMKKYDKHPVFYIGGAAIAGAALKL
ncbi:MAG: chromate transporter [Synergistaceae bacterium]|jgi:chromate transporter|nr:chromate transporter [Synergistaceae bacterium]